MKNKLALIVMFIMAATTLFSQEVENLPKNPEPGRCYVRCITPDVFETVKEKILIKPAYKILSVEPAEYEWKEERVISKPATKKYIYVPAEFEEYKETVLLEEGYNKVSLLEHQLSDHVEKIEVEPTRQRWEYSNIEDCKSEDPFDCRVLCYVEYPAVFTNIPYKKLDKDASYNTSPVDEKMQTLKKWRIKNEARVDEIEIPAEFITVKKKVLVKDETVTEEIIPAEYSTYTREILAEKGGLTVWKEVECKLVNYNVLPIYYELASAKLTSDSKTTIDNTLLKLMTDMPGVKVELSSHTDSRGDDDSNMSLSEKRAISVVNYLINKGINASRLVAKGYGESRLINRCENGITCTEGEHRENRRTEFRIINY